MIYLVTTDFPEPGEPCIQSHGVPVPAGSYQDVNSGKEVIQLHVSGSGSGVTWYLFIRSSSEVVCSKILIKSVCVLEK